MRFILGLVLHLALTSGFTGSRSAAAEAPAQLFFAHHLSAQDFRQTYRHLSDEAFALKREAAFGSALLFFRSYVNTFYFELSSQPSTGAPVLCLGDAHPENFGFLSFPSGVRFVFNDLDDSGMCSGEFDVLRYFTALQLSFNDDHLTQAVLREFVAVYAGLKSAESIRPTLVPDLRRVMRRELAKYVAHGRFVDHARYQPVAAPMRRLLKRTLSRFQILDAVEVKRESGGSAGLKRYWLLVSRGKELEILELKQVIRPGVEFELRAPKVSPDFETLKHKIWGESPEVYHRVRSGGVDYVLRTRARADVDLAKLKGQELVNYLKVQAGILASFHRSQLNFGPVAFEEWLATQVPVMSARYRYYFERR